MGMDNKVKRTEKKKSKAKRKNHVSERSTNSAGSSGANAVRARRRGFGAFHFKAERLHQKLQAAVHEGEVSC